MKFTSYASSGLSPRELMQVWVIFPSNCLMPFDATLFCWILGRSPMRVIQSDLSAHIEARSLRTFTQRKYGVFTHTSTVLGLVKLLRSNHTTNASSRHNWPFIPNLYVIVHLNTEKFLILFFIILLHDNHLGYTFLWEHDCNISYLLSK